jgi:hypothetical protein
MIKRAIRNLQTNSRFCDIIVDNKKIYLEQKSKDRYGNAKISIIEWNELKVQVEAAVKAES